MVAMKKLLFVCVIAACGGGSPVSSSVQVKDLSDAEALDECDYLLGEYPQKSWTCTIDGQTESGHLGLPADACNASNDQLNDVPDTCTATVGDVEDCLDGEYALSQDDICTALANNTAPAIPASCSKITSDACSTDDSSARALPSVASLLKLRSQLLHKGR